MLCGTSQIQALFYPLIFISTICLVTICSLILSVSSQNRSTAWGGGHNSKKGYHLKKNLLLFLKTIFSIQSIQQNIHYSIKDQFPIRLWIAYLKPQCQCDDSVHISYSLHGSRVPSTITESKEPFDNEKARAIRSFWPKIKTPWAYKHFLRNVVNC